MVTRFNLSSGSQEGLEKELEGASILVTGATGSFGQAFISRLLDFAPVRRLIVFSRDELKQFEMQQNPDLRDKREMRYFIGDVRDQARLELAMRDVDFVIHAAALKQVATAEYNPFECINTNVVGAENIVRAALKVGVRKVVALSTDKAVNPINLYGASKLAADKIFVAANHLSGSQETFFSVIRYGNVSGSRGSVVPFFRRLILEGADHLPITDPRMTRFWITLPECCDFVLSCLLSMEGGEIFVPKIPSMKVVDLATAMAPDLPQKSIGIRPGEKLHESLISKDDGRATLDAGKYYVIEPEFDRLFGSNRRGDQLGERMGERFTYTSDENEEWLDVDALNEMIAEST